MKKLVKAMTAVLLTLVMLTGFGLTSNAAGYGTQYVNMNALQGLVGFYGSNWPTDYQPFCHLVGSYRFSYSAPSGVFGKDPTDFSMRVVATSIPQSVGTYMETKAITEDTFVDGDVLVYGFKRAASVMRNLSIEVAGSYSNNSFLVVATGGGVTFAGASRGTISGYSIDRWYDYKIIVKFGTPTTASLYIDGYPYAEDIQISSGLVESFTKWRLNFNGGNLTVGQNCDTYLDDLKVGKYNTPQQAPVLNLSIDNGNLLQSGAAILCYDRSLTVAQLLEDVTGNYTSATFYDKTYVQKSESDSISDGYIKFTLADGNEVFRDVSLENPEVYADSFDEYSDEYTGAVTTGLTSSTWHQRTILGGLGGKTSTNKSLAIVTTEFDNSNTGYAKPYFDYVSTYTYSGVWTYEFASYRTNPQSFFKFAIPYLTTDGSTAWLESPFTITGEDTVEKWHKVAITCDTGEKTVKVYVNGQLKKTFTVQALAGINRIKIELSYEAATETEPLSGTAAIDDFKFHMGAYENADVDTLTLSPKASDASVGGDVIYISEENMTKAAFLNLFILENSTIKIFDDADLTTTELADVYDSVGPGQYVVVYSASGEATSGPYSIEIGNLITFTREGDSITANVLLDELDPALEGVMLIIAQKDGNRLIKVSVGTLADLDIEDEALTATINVAGDKSGSIYAYLWDGNLAPIASLTYNGSL